MKREIIKDLLKWKESSNRKPLIIRGARQVGKTWLMKEFGRQFFPKVAYVSFYNNKRMSDVFEMDFDIQRILMNLNIETGVTITPGDTLIILDEIQAAEVFLRRCTGVSCSCSGVPVRSSDSSGSILSGRQGGTVGPLSFEF